MEKHIKLFEEFASLNESDEFSEIDIPKWLVYNDHWTTTSGTSKFSTPVKDLSSYKKDGNYIYIVAISDDNGTPKWLQNVAFKSPDLYSIQEATNILNTMYQNKNGGFAKAILIDYPKSIANFKMEQTTFDAIENAPLK